MLRYCLPALLLLCCTTADAQSPNVVVIFCDDLGYGDLGCFGHPSIATPNLDRMATEGQRWTEFYVAACVCTPSRAALQTGRYPIRNGMCSSTRRVLFPDSKGGLPAGETTIGSMLHQHGYATHAIGKWHLGHLPQFLPTSHGYDSYFGIPYSNDMDAVKEAPRGKARFNDPKTDYFNVPLMRGEDIVERPADQHTITKRFTDEAVKLITQQKDKPFFIYLAHNLPHVPLFVSKDFTDVSRRGLYGDVIEEIDWSVGQVMQALKDAGVDRNTLVVFTSDNGPWTMFGPHGGTAAPLRGEKGTSWEGGYRVPGIFRWPGRIRPGKVHGMGANLDLYATFAALCDGQEPTGARGYISKDLTGVLFNNEASPRRAWIYSSGAIAFRSGKYKIHLSSKDRSSNPDTRKREPVKQYQTPLLFDLSSDVGEHSDIASAHPDVVSRLLKEMNIFNRTN